MGVSMPYRERPSGPNTSSHIESGRGSGARPSPPTSVPTLGEGRNAGGTGEPPRASCLNEVGAAYVTPPRWCGCCGWGGLGPQRPGDAHHVAAAEPLASHAVEDAVLLPQDRRALLGLDQQGRCAVDLLLAGLRPGRDRDDERVLPVLD